MKRSFISEYFEGKSGDRLKATITPHWDDTTLKRHLEIVKCPENIFSICEIGVGTGRILSELKAEHKVGCDASQSMIDTGKQEHPEIEFIKVSGNGKLPIPLNDYFDFVFSIVTFQHIPNTDTVKNYIDEMYRLVKFGGKVRFQILKDNEFPDKDLWSWHNPDELIRYMNILGFKEVNKEVYGRWVVLEGIK